jgi:diguanylate cyclase (GGDEF)-like protein
LLRHGSDGTFRGRGVRGCRGAAGYAQLSRIDPLTGVANRRHFSERLEALAQAGDGSAFALLILDIDHFKRINDRHGHAVGDACLQAIAARMRAAFPASALLARLGGEEFGVLIEDPAGPAVQSAEAFRATLATTPLDCDGADVQLTVSIGVGVFEPRRHGDGDGFYRAVDRALYDAKERGRNRVQQIADADA